MGGVFDRYFRDTPISNFVNGLIRIHGDSYVIQERLGSNGFNNVYSTRAPNGTNVAIKVIDINGMRDAGENLIAAYSTEVKLLARLGRDSRHFVAVHDFYVGRRSGQAYIVMELGNDNLSKVVERSWSMSQQPSAFVDPVLRKRFWRQMVGIIKKLRANNIVHMDLKPDNFILFGRTLKIADLGTEKKSKTLRNAAVPPSIFSAPEIMLDITGQHRYYGSKADIWSLGAILYFMTYGQPPVYHTRAAEPLPGQQPAQDPALRDILRRTLVVNPAKRADIKTLLRHPYTRY